jgi:GTP cyclohydrolase II
MRQEGRGIGLINKVRAYRLQDAGADTVEANHELGFDADQRSYTLASPCWPSWASPQLRLMTNNPRKMNALEQAGIPVTERLPLLITRNPFNQRYLSVKAAKLGHFIPDEVG